MCMKKEIGILIKNRRLKLGFTLRELSKKIDVSPVYLCNIENGNRNLPSNEIIIKIANVLFPVEPDKEDFFDIISKYQNKIPIDIEKYLVNNRNAIKVIRCSNKLNLTNENWEYLHEIINEMQEK